jgi:hypothetical protein
MRIGYFRIGVFVDKFDVALEQLKNVPSPRRAIVDSGIVLVDGAECRVDVFTADFESLKKRFEKVS